MNHSKADQPSEAEDQELQTEELEEASGGFNSGTPLTGAMRDRQRTPSRIRPKDVGVTNFPGDALKPKCN